MQLPNCNAPTLEECVRVEDVEDTCFLVSHLSHPVYQAKGCSADNSSNTIETPEELAALVELTKLAEELAEELDDHDKKCKKWLKEGFSFDVCICNYDGCNENMANENMANPTSLASLTLLASLMLALTI